jgi:hypothetical protein
VRCSPLTEQQHHKTTTKKRKNVRFAGTTIESFSSTGGMTIGGASELISVNDLSLATPTPTTTNHAKEDNKSNNVIVMVTRDDNKDDGSTISRIHDNNNNNQEQSTACSSENDDESNSNQITNNNNNERKQTGKLNETATTKPDDPFSHVTIPRCLLAVVRILPASYTVSPSPIVSAKEHDSRSSDRNIIDVKKFGFVDFSSSRSSGNSASATNSIAVKALVDRTTFIVETFMEDVIKRCGAHLIEYRNDTFIMFLRLSNSARGNMNGSRLTNMFVTSLNAAAKKISEYDQDQEQKIIRNNSILYGTNDIFVSDEVVKSPSSPKRDTSSRSALLQHQQQRASRSPCLTAGLSVGPIRLFVDNEAKSTVYATADGTPFEMFATSFEVTYVSKFQQTASSSVDNPLFSEQSTISHKRSQEDEDVSKNDLRKMMMNSVYTQSGFFSSPSTNKNGEKRRRQQEIDSNSNSSSSLLYRPFTVFAPSLSEAVLV